MTKLVDLTHPLTHGMPVFPGDPPPVIEPLATVSADGFNTTRVDVCSHTGTHLDVPYHFYDDGKTLDEMDLSAFYGPATVLKVAGASITAELLQPRAEAFQPGARVLLQTGWERHFGTPAFFQGYPSLTAEASRWIASRRIALLGLDTPSPSEDFTEVHRILLGADIVIVEALANIDALPPHFTLCCFPLKLTGRDGSPVRAVAVANCGADS